MSLLNGNTVGSLLSGLSATRGLLLFLSLVAGLLVTGCNPDEKVAGLAPEPSAPPNGLTGSAIRLHVDLKAGRVTMAQSAPAETDQTSDDLGPSFALLGRNEIGAVIGPVTRSAVGAVVPNRVRVTFELSLINKLLNSDLVPSTFPTPPVPQVVAFPFSTEPAGLFGLKVRASSDWDGAAHNFFNDAICISLTPPGDCFRWEAFGAALAAGATSAARTVGFDVDPSVTSFTIFVVVAADIRERGTPPGKGGIAGVVTSPERGGLAGVTVRVVEGGASTQTNGSGFYTLSGLDPGQVSVVLENLPSGCVAPTEQSATVQAGNVVTLNFSVSCPATPPGDDLDGDGVTVGAGDCNDGDPAIRPGALDLPDAEVVDANCDGLDGERGNSIFVATTGFDAAACGTDADPCRSVQHAIGRAQAAGRRDVYLFVGNHSGPRATVGNGINLFGGFSRNGTGEVVRLAAPATPSRLLLSAPGADGNYITVLAQDLTQPTRIGFLSIAGANAPTAPSGEGLSSYALLSRNVASDMLRLEHLTIEAGSGGQGASGTHGASAAPGGSGMNGVRGLNAVEVSICNDDSRNLGGAAGVGATTGGRGGDGGKADTNCNPFTLNFTATNGSGGVNGALATGSFGLGGSGGAGAEVCSNPAPGQPGRPGSNGAAGAGGTSGTLVTGLWRSGSGTHGGLGTTGGGGGGGGGAGGCDFGTDEFGASGGGGGGGGSPAPIAGRAGQGGGGSFAIYLIDASPRISSTLIIRGAGGNGGNGGNGGQGQVGGTGGPGGSGIDGANGGNGGDGGRGGSSGSGGGGAGGPSVGIFRSSETSSPVLDAATSFTGGEGGAPGSGGIAPFGTSGGSGAAGESADQLLCANPSGC